jgi:hypothetical protein
MHWLVSASAKGALATDSAGGEGSVRSRCRLGRGETQPHARGVDWKFLVVLAAIFLAARPMPAAAAPTVWVEPSMVRVGPDAAAGSGTSIDLYAAKGESESFQIIVRGPTGGLTNVNVTAPNLGGPQVTLYREHYVYLARGTADWASNRNSPLGPGWYPDGLIPFKNPATGADLTGAALDAVPFNLPAGKNQPIWADVYVPPSAAAGQYHGTFTVTSGQGQSQVTLNLTVWNFKLPVQPALPSSVLCWTVRGQLQPEMELLRNRLMPANITASDGTTLVNAGLSAVNIGFWSGADGTTCTVTNPAPSSSTVASTASKYPAALRKYAYTADEISGCSGLVSTMQAYASALHSADVDQLITMPPKSGWEGIVDIWVELPKQYSASAVQAAIGRGESVWSYNCLQQDDYSPKWLLDYAPINYRIQPGFINQSLGMTGLLYWRADYWTSDPWNNVTAYSGYPGEGLLVYPGQQVGISGVVPSMRLKYLRDGVDDYDYIQLLKERGLGDWALSVARSIGPDWTNWTRDPKAVEDARRRMGATLSAEASSDSISVSVTATPTSIESGGQVALTGSAIDSQGHSIVSWAWSDGGAGGSFAPSASAQSPTYTAPINPGEADVTVALTLTAGCGAAEGSGSLSLVVQPFTGVFLDVPESYWAYSEIAACVDAGVVVGYPDQYYRPTWPVNRGQMAAYLARALAGGDDLVPAVSGDTSFPDVPADFWAADYIQYVTDMAIATGYGDGLYHPTWTITRAQMAVFLARALVAPEGDTGLASFVPPASPTFPDVPLSYWASQHVEYLASLGVASGYPDGLFRPTATCTRDQMAVYIARAFGLIEQ